MITIEEVKLMRSRFASGMLTGSLIGATIGVFAYGKMTPRQKKSFMKNGSKIFKKAANLMEDIQILKALR